jgi:hypothetical protein
MNHVNASRILSLAAACCGLVLLWFLYVSELSWMEALVGLVPVILTLVGTSRAGQHEFAEFQPRPSWLLQAVSLPVQLAKDCVTVLAVLGRRILGNKEELAPFRVVHFAKGDDSPKSRARRALAIGLTSLPPNCYVISIDLEQEIALYDELVAQSSAPEPLKSLGEETA